MISVEHMQELIDRFNSGELDIRDIIEQSYFGGRADAFDEFVKAINDNSHRIKDKEATGERTMLFIWEDDLKRIVKELKGQEDE